MPLVATYESLARKGETMTAAEIVTYAYDRIVQARAGLNTVSKSILNEVVKPLRC